MPYVFISYSRKDAAFVERLYADLKSNNINAWVDTYKISPGQNWDRTIHDALENASALILVISPDSMASQNVHAEYLYALEMDKPVLPIVVREASIPLQLRLLQYLDFRDSYELGLSKLIGALKSRWSPESIEPPPQEKDFEQSNIVPEPANKGYAFLSYISEDADFIDKLKDFLETRGYAFWDYRESERDYNTELYRELESKIEEAAVFISVLSDAWRKTLWTAREYVYAEEAKVPVFVVQAKPLDRPVPILLNLRTRIDMSKDFNAGIKKLDEELDKKGL